jgi:tetratricopeptide (TPR) repeat protein
MAEINWKNSFSQKTVVFLFFLFFIVVIYSNTFNASWHLDDQPNIINNIYLHIDSFHLKNLVNTFFTDPHNPEVLSKKPYRPVACLTFAINWYFGHDQVFGYHIVNISIHFLTAFFLFLFILKLFNTPNLKNQQSSPFLIALLSSMLWAANPIQTQAVTYIVQRMTLLAAFFYILGMYSYINARLCSESTRRFVWFGLCPFFYFLAFFSKQNAVMMPIALMLLEITFFQNLSSQKVRKSVLIIVSAAFAFVLLAGALAFLKPDLFMLDLYSTRTFTLSERLLTQPRIVLFYLSQIFYPLPGRLSIAHDIILSTSIANPWTTLPSILIIFFMIGFSIFHIQNWPIFSFSVLFFFLNHIIESSIIPLELIFEHRNYLPSFFLFLPLCLVSYHAIDFIKKKNKIIAIFIIISIFLYIIFFMTGTFLRNQVWKDDITLWTNTLSKAPNDARAYNILAIKLAWGDASTHPNRFDMALKLFEQSLEKNMPSTYLKADVYGNMALVYFHNKQNPAKAFEYFDKALEIDSPNLKIRRDLIEALIIHRDFDNALKQMNILLLKNEKNGRYHNLKGHILLWQGKYDAALKYFENAYRLSTNKASVLLNTAVALSLSGEYASAEHILSEAIESFPDDMTYYFALIENSVRAKDDNKLKFYIEKVLTHFNIDEVRAGLDSFTDNPKMAPLSKNLSFLIDDFIITRADSHFN